jgi:hypothetical protein
MGPSLRRGATAGAMNQKYKKREREKPLKGFFSLRWLEICACGGGVTSQDAPF